MNNKLCLVYTTYSDYDVACKISDALLQEGLIACVNLFPEVTSMYLWDGHINTSREYVAIMKTLGHLAAKVQQRIKKSHPYATPAIFSITTQDCDQGFLDWVNRSIKSSGFGGEVHCE